MVPTTKPSVPEAMISEEDISFEEDVCIEDVPMDIKSEYITCDNIPQIKCEQLDWIDSGPYSSVRASSTRASSPDLEDMDPSSQHPASTLLQLPTLHGEMIPQNLVLPAYYLFLQGNYGQVLSYIRSTPFPSGDHPTLQTLWFECLYERMKYERGFESLNPAQKYRIRCKNPIPPNIAATKFRTNNMFDSATRAVLDTYFEKSKYLQGEEYKTIMQQTNLTQSQIKNYFKNKRSRGK